MNANQVTRRMPMDYKTGCSYITTVSESVEARVHDEPFHVRYDGCRFYIFFAVTVSVSVNNMVSHAEISGCPPLQLKHICQAQKVSKLNESRHDFAVFWKEERKG